jgi:hypothetical protein
MEINFFGTEQELLKKMAPGIHCYAFKLLDNILIDK